MRKFQLQCYYYCLYFSYTTYLHNLKCIRPLVPNKTRNWNVSLGNRFFFLFLGLSALHLLLRFSNGALRILCVGYPPCSLSDSHPAVSSTWIEARFVSLVWNTGTNKVGYQVERLSYVWFFFSVWSAGVSCLKVSIFSNWWITEITCLSLQHPFFLSNITKQKNKYLEIEF